MPSAVGNLHERQAPRRLLGLLAVLSLVSGCATTGELRGRLAMSGDDPGEAVVYLIPAHAQSPGPGPGPVGGPPPGNLSGPRAPGPPPTAAAPVSVTARGFEPRVLAVTRGTALVFRNSDRVYHLPFSISPACRFRLEGLAPGAERSVTFDTPGVVNLYCELHPGAAGFVVVRPDRLFVRPKPDGSFVLARLRPGPYVLKAWHPQRGETSRRVEVARGRPVDVKLALAR